MGGERQSQVLMNSGVSRPNLSPVTQSPRQSVTSAKSASKQLLFEVSKLKPFWPMVAASSPAVQCSEFSADYSRRPVTLLPLSRPPRAVQ